MPATIVGPYQCFRDRGWVRGADCGWTLLILTSREQETHQCVENLDSFEEACRQAERLWKAQASPEWRARWETIRRTSERAQDS